MVLYANDFGCVPDGRFLERASIAENSALLTDRDGRLRPTDVGKHVAIPGAGDLVTTIARLVDRREVRNATMDAGGAQPQRLTGTLFDPQLPAGSDGLNVAVRSPLTGLAGDVATVPVPWRQMPSVNDAVAVRWASSVAVIVTSYTPSGRSWPAASVRFHVGWW